MRTPATDSCRASSRAHGSSLLNTVRHMLRIVARVVYFQSLVFNWLLDFWWVMVYTHSLAVFWNLGSCSMALCIGSTVNIMETHLDWFGCSTLAETQKALFNIEWNNWKCPSPWISFSNWACNAFWVCLLRINKMRTFLNLAKTRYLNRRYN